MFRQLRLVAVAAALMGLAGTPIAAAQTNLPYKLIFETRHLDLVSKGLALTYQYEHEVSDEKLLGKAYSDDIRVGILKVDHQGKRDVSMQIFFGERARNRWNETGLTLNPILVWFMNNSVNQFQAVSGAAKFSYLKDRFSKAFLSKRAKVEKITATYDGKNVEAHKVTLQPYKGEPAVRKMEGFEKSTFVSVFSKAVPGYFLEMTANIESRMENTPKMVERITFKKVGELP